MTEALVRPISVKPFEYFLERVGLSISRQIVEAHGGAIWVENRIAKSAAPSPDAEPKVAGARFIVRLPAT